MIFNFTLNGKEYSMDLSPESRVAIVRHLLNLHKEYCAANPTENISFEDYLTLVEKSPHPENVPTPPVNDDDLTEDELIDYGALTEVVRHKDVMIDVLLEVIGRLR